MSAILINDRKMMTQAELILEKMCPLRFLLLKKSVKIIFEINIRSDMDCFSNVYKKNF